jgi:hypothetical protein
MWNAKEPGGSVLFGWIPADLLCIGFATCTVNGDVPQAYLVQHWH